MLTPGLLPLIHGAAESVAWLTVKQRQLYPSVLRPEKWQRGGSRTHRKPAFAQGRPAGRWRGRPGWPAPWRYTPAARPGIQLVPASGTRAIAAASIVNATRSSGSRLCRWDFPHARASVCASSTSVRR